MATAGSMPKPCAGSSLPTNRSPRCKLGELWAIPIMLRLALIENLRRVGGRVIAEKIDRRLAEHWADQLMDVVERDPKNVVLAVADMARSDPPMSSSFVAEFTRRLLGQSSALALPLTWVEHWLSGAGYTIEHLVQMEAQQQAADQVSIGNSIGSLRALSSIDWREFVESMSLVETTLREDPAGVYPGMDFATRDHYRHVVESVARRSNASEPEVARAAVDLADAAQSAGDRTRAVHVGFYLLGDGLQQLERAVDARIGLAEWMRRIWQKWPLPFYLGSIAGLTFLFAKPLLQVASDGGFRDGSLWLLGFLAIIATSQLAIALVNWMATLWVSPSGLPRMDFSKGVPEQARTLVVVPTMLSSEQGVDDLVEALEVRYLANSGHHLHFGLLTDFLDAPQAETERDEPLLQRAQQGIEQLNARYSTEEQDRFFLFHRPRCWNARERRWMGFERKRGKLADLNALLRGGGRENFSRLVGDITILTGVKYVITLDTDSQLPRDAAAQLIGAMEHPLNRPRCNPATRMVDQGYGILQPRIGISLPSTARSNYSRLFGSEAGVDPYTRTVSDVYQDVFQEGSFIGKGIYDVDAFEFALAGRFLDNRILSHDLIEGCHARSGLLSDVQLYEEAPSTYRADASRRHRWIRGDWQLLPWVLPWVKVRGGGRERNFLSALSLWKILDNLRRSMVAEALLGLLLFGWLMTSAPLFWTVAVLAILLLPPLLATLLDLAHKPDDVVMDQHVAAVLDSAGHRFIGLLLTLAWLPHEAFYSLEAILRTLWRMVISRRRLLQWHPSSEVARAGGNQLGALVRFMWFGPALALVTAAVLTLQRPSALVVALPLLLSWFLSPALAWWASRPQPDRRSPALGRTTAVPASPCAQDLGLLRDLCRSRRQLAAAGQRAGATRRGGRPPHFADQHGARVAGEPGGARFRLPRPGAPARTDDQHTADHAAHGAPSRSFLQLVRHADTAAIGAALCFLGG